MDVDLLERAAKINGVTKLVINKVDVLEQIETWKLFHGIDMLQFENAGSMYDYIESHLGEASPGINVLFSGNKEII